VARSSPALSGVAEADAVEADFADAQAVATIRACRFGDPWYCGRRGRVGISRNARDLLTRRDSAPRPSRAVARSNACDDARAVHPSSRPTDPPCPAVLCGPLGTCPAPRADLPRRTRFVRGVGNSCSRRRIAGSIHGPASTEATTFTNRSFSRQSGMTCERLG
jgi:hypothetical protein